MAKRLKLILHVGMGKTGTSSIQAALHENQKSGNLASQQAAYLGMYFGFLGEGFPRDAETLRSFLYEKDALVDTLSTALFKHLSDRAEAEGVWTFVFSNEMLNASAEQIFPIVNKLEKLGVEVSIVLFLRGARSWINSAYNQWGVKHKTYPGEIQSFSDRAPLLMAQYGGALKWCKIFSEKITVCLYERGQDVVAQFSTAIGLRISPLERRVLESPPPFELLLRAIFNSSIENPTLPQVFDKATQMSRLSDGASVEELAMRVFDRSSSEDVVMRSKQLLDELRIETGYDLLSDTPERPESLEFESLRDDLLSHALKLILNQAERISVLENRMRRIERKQAEN